MPPPLTPVPGRRSRRTPRSRDRVGVDADDAAVVRPEPVAAARDRDVERAVELGDRAPHVLVRELGDGQRPPGLVLCPSPGRARTDCRRRRPRTTAPRDRSITAVSVTPRTPAQVTCSSPARRDQTSSPVSASIAWNVPCGLPRRSGSSECPSTSTPEARTGELSDFSANGNVHSRWRPADVGRAQGGLVGVVAGPLVSYPHVGQSFAASAGATEPDTVRWWPAARAGTMAIPSNAMVRQKMDVDGAQR